MNLPQTLQPDSAPPWRALDDLPGERPSAALRGILTTRGSMTGVLRDACRGEFRLALLALQEAGFEAYQAGELGGSTGLVREVLMTCGERPWVFAQTLIPAATKRAHPWLAALADQPLGDRLFRRDDVTRSEFLYAWLAPGAPLYARVADVDDSTRGKLWARRSYFYLRGLPLLVNEVFLPDLVAWYRS